MAKCRILIRKRDGKVVALHNDHTHQLLKRVGTPVIRRAADIVYDNDEQGWVVYGMGRAGKRIRLLAHAFESHAAASAAEQRHLNARLRRLPEQVPE